jgi:hypothetical protein
MVALGKEIDIQSDSIRDTPQRVAGLHADVQNLCELAGQPSSQRNGRPTVPVPLLREIIGKTMQTEPHLRPGANLPIRALRILSVESISPDKERAYRSSHRKASKDRHGFSKCPWFSNEESH